MQTSRFNKLGCFYFFFPPLFFSSDGFLEPSPECYADIVVFLMLCYNVFVASDQKKQWKLFLG